MGERKFLKRLADGRPDGKVEVSKTHSASDIAHEIFLPYSNSGAMPALAGVTTFALPQVLVRADDWFQNAATDDIRYKAWSKPANILSLSQLKPEPGKPGQAYLSKIAGPLGTRLSGIAQTITTSEADLSGRVKILQQFFQNNFTYSKVVENKSNKPPLENFLFEEKKGYCDFFASAAAVILRHMNIPSRVAYGYKSGEYHAESDAWVFREFHSHSWTEIFVKDHGWVICDFTPLSRDFPSSTTNTPSFTLSDFRDASAGSKNKLWNGAESLQILRSPWLWVSLASVMLAAILAFLLTHRSPEQRAARKAARKQAKNEAQPTYFIEFLRMCNSLGHNRAEGQTLMEFHKRLKQARFYNDDFDDLADYYYKSRYEDAPQNETTERGFLHRIHQFWTTKASKTTAPPD